MNPIELVAWAMLALAYLYVLARLISAAYFHEKLSYSRDLFKHLDQPGQQRRVQS